MRKLVLCVAAVVLAIAATGVARAGITSPLDIPNCSIWLDGQDTSTVVTAPGGLWTPDTLISWTDKANGYLFAASLPGWGAKDWNYGAAAMLNYFAVLNSPDTGADSPIDFTTEMTGFVIAQHWSDQGWSGILQKGGDVYDWALLHNDASNTSTAIGGSPSGWLFSDVLHNDAWYANEPLGPGAGVGGLGIYEVRVDFTNSIVEYWLNGFPIGTVTTDGSGDPLQPWAEDDSSLNIGTQWGNHLNGYLMDVVLYKGALTDAQRRDVGRWLALQRYMSYEGELMIPEPAGLGLLGVALLAMRKRRS